MDSWMGITNEVLAAKMDALAQSQHNLEVKVEALPSQIDHSYIRADIFDLRMKEMDTQILMVKSEMMKLANRKNLINWITPTISAVLGSVLTFLIIDRL